MWDTPRGQEGTWDPKRTWDPYPKGWGTPLQRDLSDRRGHGTPNRHRTPPKGCRIPQRDRRGHGTLKDMGPPQRDEGHPKGQEETWDPQRDVGPPRKGHGTPKGPPPPPLERDKKTPCPPHPPQRHPEGTQDPPPRPFIGAEMPQKGTFGVIWGGGSRTCAGFSHFFRKSSFARAKNSFTVGIWGGGE